MTPREIVLVYAPQALGQRLASLFEHRRTLDALHFRVQPDPRPGLRFRHMDVWYDRDGMLERGHGDIANAVEGFLERELPRLLETVPEASVIVMRQGGTTIPDVEIIL